MDLQVHFERMKMMMTFTVWMKCSCGYLTPKVKRNKKYNQPDDPGWKRTMKIAATHHESCDGELKEDYSCLMTF